MTANNPTHGGITAQTVGIVHVVVATKTAKNGLAELADHAVPPVLASATVGKNIASHLTKFNGVIKLSVGKQPGVRGDCGTVELQLQATVEIDPKAHLFRFTYRMRHIHRSICVPTA